MKLIYQSIKELAPEVSWTEALRIQNLILLVLAVAEPGGVHETVHVIATSYYHSSVLLGPEAFCIFISLYWFQAYEYGLAIYGSVATLTSIKPKHPIRLTRLTNDDSSRKTVKVNRDTSCDNMSYCYVHIY